MRYSKSVFILVMLLLLGLMAANVRASQPLPAAAWYAVLWVREGDQLYWVNQNGLQASLQRPTLPNEKLTGSNPRLKISPDGRYMVVAASLNSGLEGLGIYDIQGGVFVQTHTAQSGEQISLGGSNPFTQDGRFMAVGLSSGSAWRIITFEMKTGSALETLSSSDENAPTSGGQVMPFVVYYNLNLELELEQVYFQLIPLGTGGAVSYPAYGWSPLFGQIFDSPYKYSTMDLLANTGEMTRPGIADNAPLLPPNGPAPSFNAVVREVPNQPIQIEAVKSDRYVQITRWAKGGDWLLFQTSDAQGGMNWNITETASTSENNNQFQFDSSIVNAYGTSNGYFFTDKNLRVLYTNGFTTNTAPMIWQAPDTFEVAYVTPIGASFSLNQVGDPGAVAQPTPFPVGIGPQCGSSLPARLLPNMTARVTFTDGASLRMRQTPGGIIMTYLPEGTTFKVLEGPQCVNFFNWWRIQLADGRIGWAAEANIESYFIEPWNPAGTPQPNATQPTVIILPTPTAVGANTVALLPDGNCNLAPLPSVAVGDTATVTVGGTATLAIRQNPTDQFPSAQIPNGQQVSIVEGPQCHQGYRLWRVVVVSGAVPSGWVSDGTQVEYFLKK